MCGYFSGHDLSMRTTRVPQSLKMSFILLFIYTPSFIGPDGFVRLHQEARAAVNSQREDFSVSARRQGAVSPSKIKIVKTDYIPSFRASLA